MKPPSVSLRCFLRPLRAASLVSLAPLAAAACTLVSTRTTPTTSTSSTPVSVEIPSIPPDVEVTLKGPGEAHAELCAPDDAHPNFPDDADLVTKVFCQDLKPGGVMPTPKGLAELLALLGLSFTNPNGGNGVDGNPAFAILAHSSALTARKVTTVTPTVFVFTPPPADGSKPTGQYAFLAFDPGEQFVETAVLDPTVNAVNFYVIFFDQVCNTAPGGCTNEDLLTQKLITGWSNVRVYEMSTSLGNTIFDCHVCHQTDNTKDAFLRMQEIEPPFTHWMSSTTTGGRALLADFHAMYGTNQDYGPIPAALIDKSDPSKMAAFINQAGFVQPNKFPSSQIEAEVAHASPQQPLLNVPRGASPTWQALYDDAAAGTFIAAPYHDVKVTDPRKLASATSLYKQWLAGTSATFPDLRDTFLNDGLRDMGFAPKLGLDGRGMLAQMCQQCHNSNLDMTISREKFLVDQIDQMSREEKNVAISRLMLDPSTRLRMPPPLYRTLTDYEREQIVLALEQ